VTLSITPQALWLLLAQDLSIAPGFQAPLLSLCGAAGVLLLVFWHSARLLRGFIQIRRAFKHVLPHVAELVQARSAHQQDWITIPSLRRPRVATTDTGSGRRDLDDLYRLDRLLRAEPPLAADWLSFRKTLVVEQPSWFMEPTVHSSKPAGECFSLERLYAGRLDLRFYRQLPSVITGIGLTFTFLAILIGLSKLHADGSHIEGLQGLVNGLAGKFLSSIVGLVCANFFVFFEKSLFHRLDDDHRHYLILLDQMFPQAVQDRSVQLPPPAFAKPLSVSQVPLMAATEGRLSTLDQRLEATVTALTTLSHSLGEWERPPAAIDHDALASAIGKSMKRELAPILDPLLAAVQELSAALQSAPPSRGPSQDRPAANSHHPASLELGHRFFERLNRTLLHSLPRT